VLTFVLDMLKGMVPTIVGGFALGTIANPGTSNAMAIAWLAFGVAAFMGHLFPVWLRFKGGKGVATGFGALLGVFPLLTIPALVAIGAWALSVRVTRYVGLSSCIGAATLPISTIFIAPISRAAGLFYSPASGMTESVVSPHSFWPNWGVLWPYLSVSALLGGFVIYRHRANFARIREGTEPKVPTRAQRAAAKAAKREPAPAAPASADPTAPASSR
jgi:glycerol-3-phosphate acyltransferase PlsY